MIGASLPLLLFLVPFLAALATAGTGAVFGHRGRRFALAALGSTALLSTLAVVEVLRAGPLRIQMGSWPAPHGIEWSLDPLGALVAAIVGWIALATVAATGEAVRDELAGREAHFHAAALMLVAGLMGMAATADLFNFFVHLELTSLAAYALVGAGAGGAPRAAMRYLLVGSLGASLYLLGVGHLYAATGSLHIGDVSTRLAEVGSTPLTLLGQALVAAGLAVKMGLFPVHGWMPAAYARAPLASAALMAPLVTKVAAFGLVRILFGVFGGPVLGQDGVLLEVLAWAGAAAIVSGAAMAAIQDDLRALLVYSSVSQMGVVALGVGLATRTSMTGALLHLANDSLMKAVLFVAAAILAGRFGVRRVSELARARGRAPWTSAAVAIAVLSLVGIPPLAGFFGKWYVLAGALDRGRIGFVAALATGSLLGIVYAFRILEGLYVRPSPDREPAPSREGPALPVLACAALGAALIALGLGNERIVTLLVDLAVPSGL